MAGKFVNQIEPRILAILAECKVQGNEIAITSGQLDRPTYLLVNKVLELMGGKWNRSKRTHVFAEPPDDLLDTVLLTGEITDKKKLFQFYETPDDVARRMVNLARIRPDDNVLEPSAGNGAIARAIVGSFGTELRNGDISLTLVDADPVRSGILERDFGNNASVRCQDFLQIDGLGFERILMNPPFTRGQDVAHIKHALRMLRHPGGRLVAICSGGPRAEKELKPLASTWDELPPGTFAQSGTNVRAILATFQ